MPGLGLVIAQRCFVRKSKQEGFYFSRFWKSHAGQSKTTKGLCVAREFQFKVLDSFIKKQLISANEPVMIAGDLKVNKLSARAEFKSMLSILKAHTVRQIGPDFPYNPKGHCLTDTTDTIQYLDYILYRTDHKIPSSARIEKNYYMLVNRIGEIKEFVTSYLIIILS